MTEKSEKEKVPKLRNVSISVIELIIGGFSISFSISCNGIFSCWFFFASSRDILKLMARP